VCAVACSDEAPARDQWVVTIATDAPPPPFFDRALVEIVGDDGELVCGSACRRLFGFADARAWPLSFGLTASTRPAHLRVRLYRSDHTAPDGFPLPPMLVDAAGRLPPARGVTPVTLELHMRCFGVASEIVGARTCDPATGELGDEPVLGARDVPIKMGSWGPAQPRPCTFAVPKGMVCVPGGVFFLGAHLPGSPVAQTTTPEHLVQVSPFALDIEEATVGDVRALVNAGAIPEPMAKTVDPFAPDHACTYLSSTAIQADAYPINCLSRALAEKACVALGKRLPTEAEYEWAAGNQGLETDYPWGEDRDACSRAIVGRGRDAVETRATEFATCRVRGSTGLLPWGPVPGGSANDVNALGIKNLAGSMGEWAADRSYSGFDDPCWGPVTKLQVDPRCDNPARETRSSVSRGGCWAFFEGFSRATSRKVEETDDAHPASESPYVGFRCAKSQ
jgi:formylglycine-generating enzyme